MPMRGKGSGSKRADGRWQTTITMGGQRRTVYGATQKEMLANAENLRRLGANNIKLFELRERWKEIFWESRAKNTQEQYNMAWSKLSDLHSMFISEITRPMVSDILNEVYKEKSRTAEMMKSHLSLMFAYAVDRGWMETNPAKDIVWRTKRIKKAHKKLSRGEVQRILNTDSPLQHFWQFLAETGLRPWSEALKLTGEHFRSIDGAWFVQVPESKTDAGIRVVPIRTDLATAIVKEGKVFLWHGLPLTKMVASHHWADLLEQLEIPHTRVYELRHYANVQLQLSDSPELLKRWIMGHAGGELGLSTYGKSSPENMMEVMEKMARSMSKSKD